MNVIFAKSSDRGLSRLFPRGRLSRAREAGVRSVTRDTETSEASEDSDHQRNAERETSYNLTPEQRGAGARR